MNISKDQIFEWIIDYIGEILLLVCILIIVFFMILLKKQYVIALLGMVSILAIGLERRSKLFDKVVSLLVVFVLTFGFMLLG
jgi:hypothetical protein